LSDLESRLQPDQAFLYSMPLPRQASNRLKPGLQDIYIRAIFQTSSGGVGQPNRLVNVTPGIWIRDDQEFRLQSEWAFTG